MLTLLRFRLTLLSGEENNSTTKTNESNEFTIFSVGSESEIESDWTINLDTNGSNVRYKLDTGAQVNVLPRSQYNRLIRKPKLKSTKVKLTALMELIFQLLESVLFE